MSGRRAGAAQLPLRDFDIVETVITAPNGARAIQVRAADAQARAEVQAEAELWEELAASSCSAAPRVLERYEDRYLRELPFPVRRASGRRVALLDTPATTERVGRARARAELELLLEEMHERGWVLAPPSGSPLAVRADGAVTVVDLRGLQRTRSLAATISDQHWITDVLADDDRTLLRPPREEAAPHLGAENLSGGAEAAVSGSVPPTEIASAVPAAADGTQVEPDELAPSVEAWLQVSDTVARSRGHGLRAPGAQAPAMLTSVVHALPVRERDADSDAEEPAVLSRSARLAALAPRRTERGRLVRGVGIVRESLRRMSGESLMIIVVSGVLLGATFWISLPVLLESDAQVDQDGTGGTGGAAAAAPMNPAQASAASEPAATGDAAVPTAASERSSAGSEGSGAGPDEQPRAAELESVMHDAPGLVAELAAARYDYVTGRSDAQIALAGSPAATEDDAARAHYEGVEVAGGVPIVESADVDAFDRAQRTATITAELRTPAHRLVGPDGASAVPESAPMRVRLHLRWSEGSWFVERSEALER